MSQARSHDPAYILDVIKEFLLIWHYTLYLGDFAARVGSLMILALQIMPCCLPKHCVGQNSTKYHMEN